MAKSKRKPTRKKTGKGSRTAARKAGAGPRGGASNKAATTPRFVPPYRTRSAIKGVIWPAGTVQKAQPVHSLAWQLEQTQWYAPEILERLQMAQLDRLLRFAQSSVPFYRERLRPVTERLAAGEALTPRLFSEVPILTRQDIQRAGSAMRAADLPKSHGEVGSTHTSGSTGKPIQVFHTELFQQMWYAVSLRNHFWHRRNLEGTLAMVRGRSVGADYPDGKRSDNWGVPGMAGIETGPLIVLDINASPAEQLDWLQRNDPMYLITHPTNLERVARHAIRHRIKLPGLREAQTVAEVLTPEIRKLTRKAWGVPVVDMYTSRDLGYIALQCPDHEHYHVQSEANRIEILGDDGRPCGPGEVGRIVATVLHEFAMPMIRYDIGDHAELGPPCSCGRGLPVLSRILGRTQQMLTLPDGEQHWTLYGDKELNALREIGVEQFQFVQKSVETMEVRLVVDEARRTEAEPGVRAWVAKQFGPQLEVELVYFDEIPRTVEGKFFEFISEVKR